MTLQPKTQSSAKKAAIAAKKRRTNLWLWPLAILCVSGCVLWAASPILRVASTAQSALAAASPAPKATETPGASREPSALARRESDQQADIAALQGLARDKEADAKARADAGAALAALVERRQTESALMAALQGMGLTPCLALYQNDSLTVMLAAERLDDAQSAAVLSLCLTHVPVRAENVRIATGAKLE